MSKLTVTVVRDYDNYFENAGKELVNQVNKECPGLIENLVVNSGPYKSCDVAYEYVEETRSLFLDYYSAIRVGFGSLHSKEIKRDIIEKYGKIFSIAAQN